MNFSYSLIHEKFSPRRQIMYCTFTFFDLPSFDFLELIIDLNQSPEPILDVK